jgi:GNAT superfamily N-acetyltransferase
MDVGNISLLPKLLLKSNYILRPATIEEERNLLTHYHTIWGYNFTLDEYISGDALLPLSSTRRCLVLATPTQILASCEYYTRPCEVKIKGEILSGLCWAIEIVYTTPENRGMGYASMMMEMVFKACKEAGCIASILYSDIGPVFYTRLGWKAYPCFSAIIDLELWKYGGGMEMVDEILPDLLSEIINIKRRDDRIGNSFSMPLTREAVDLLFARSVHYADVKEINPPVICGFRLDSDYSIFISNPQSFSTWISRIIKCGLRRVSFRHGRIHVY